MEIHRTIAPRKLLLNVANSGSVTLAAKMKINSNYPQVLSWFPFWPKVACFFDSKPLGWIVT
jgi:hypothetical protein